MFTLPPSNFAFQRKDGGPTAFVEAHMFQPSLPNGSRVFQILWLALILVARCSTPSPGPSLSSNMPTAPSVSQANPASGMNVASQATTDNGIQLMPVLGSGAGIVNDSATANDGFTLRGQVNINVHGAPPDTLLFVQIAADVGLPGAPQGQQTDGICQRANAGLFAPLALFPGGPPATLQTSPGGSGAAHTTAGVNNPFITDGGRVDVVIRLIDALPPAQPTIELRTPCYMFQIK
jgi:hypothetical protein